MSTRGRGGGARTITKRKASNRKKRCELGSTCPYQHEYQHQLEYAHDNATTTTTTTNNSSAGARAGQKPRTAAAAAGGGGGAVVKGTGSRGRKVAVAADKRRAERALRNEGEELPDGNAEDLREAQRARWIMQMQQQAQQNSKVETGGGRGNGGCGGDGGAHRDGGGASRGETKLQRERRPSKARALIPSNLHSSAKSVQRSPRGASGAAEMGEGSTSTPRKRAAPNISHKDNQRKAREDDGVGGGVRRKQRREVIQVGSDTDDEVSHVPRTINSPTTDAAAFDEAPPNGLDTSCASADKAGCRKDTNDVSESRAQRYEDHWDCHVCTFRNGNGLGLACALCGRERGPRG